MHQISIKRNRSVLLLVLIGLIGGIGCGSVPTMDPAQQRALAERIDAGNRQRIKQDADGAAAGSAPAMTRYGLDLLVGYPEKATSDLKPFLAKDLDAGMAMLLKAANLGYGQAQFLAGRLLVGVAPEYLSPGDHVDLDVTRGLELIKQSSTMLCMADGMKLFVRAKNPDVVVAELYENGVYVEKDEHQADIWRARAILACRHHPRLDRLSQVRRLAYLLLMGDQPKLINSMQTNMTSDQIALANQLAEQWRAAVSDLATVYASPPTATYPSYE